MQTRYDTDVPPAYQASDLLSYVHAFYPKNSTSRRVDGASMTLYHDSTLPDDTLHEHARTYLKVLDIPQFAKYKVPIGLHNVYSEHPSIMRRVFGQSGLQEVTTLGVIGAMYETASAINSSGGRRYVSAAICAAARQVDYFGELFTAASQLERLAMRLSELATQLSLAFSMMRVLFTTLKYTPIGSRGTSAQPSLFDWLLARDGKASVKDGVRYSARHKEFPPGSGKYGPRRPDALYATSIVPRSIAELIEGQNPSDTILDLLNDFCGCDVSGAFQTPENGFLLSGRQIEEFANLEWTLLSTETPNRYKIHTFDNRQPETARYDPKAKPSCGSASASESYVTFVDHSTQTPSLWERLTRRRRPTVPASGVPLPRPDLLRVHAATAIFLRRAGLSCHPVEDL